MRPERKKKELANWIRRKLGAPLIDVLIDSSQIDDCIDQACDFFGEHAGGIGNEESILLISPELVYYDGTGNANQPAPIAGKWRKPNPGTVGSSATPGSSGTSGCIDCPTPVNELINGRPENFPVVDISGNICPVETDPGPGWCGDGIPDKHCFTNQGTYDPSAQGPFWVEGDTTAKPMKRGFVWKTVYDVPKDIISVNSNLTTGLFGMAGNSEDNSLFTPIGILMNAGGSFGLQNSANFIDSRWGTWFGNGGYGADLVSMEIAFEFLELVRTMYTIKMEVQLNELEHKVRITPPPTQKGIIAISCVRRVRDEALYENQWVREYSFALALQVIGYNSGKYSNFTMPGGGTINSEMYFSRGDSLREKLEAQLKNDNYYSFPPDFFTG